MTLTTDSRSHRLMHRIRQIWNEHDDMRRGTRSGRSARSFFGDGESALARAEIQRLDRLYRLEPGKRR